MQTSLEHSAQQAIHWIRRYSDLVTSAPVDQVRLVDCWQRHYSQLFLLELEAKNQRHRIICKRLLHQPDNEIFYHDGSDPLAREFEILASITASIGESPVKCSVPKPLFVVPEEQSIYMEFVEGTELDAMMRHLRHFSSRSTFLQLGQAYMRVGEWLRHFQTMTGVTNANAEALNQLRSHVRHRLNLIDTYRDHRLPSDLSAVVMSKLDELQRRIEMPVQLAGCHGDFGPWNIITQDSKITVLDFFSYRRDFIGIDVLNVLINLENQNVAPSFSGRRIQRLKQSFLDGYQISELIDPSALMMAEMLQRVCAVHGSLINRNSYFRQRMRSSRILSRSLQRLMAPLPIWTSLRRSHARLIES